MDTETEHLMQQALATVMEGRTTFVIAHRLSSVTNADMILVMEGGNVVQRGTHESLIGVSGAYRDTYQLQLRPEEEEAEKVEGNK